MSDNNIELNIKGTFDTSAITDGVQRAQQALDGLKTSFSSDVALGGEDENGVASNGFLSSIEYAKEALTSLQGMLADTTIGDAFYNVGHSIQNVFSPIKAQIKEISSLTESFGKNISTVNLDKVISASNALSYYGASLQSSVKSITEIKDSFSGYTPASKLGAKETLDKIGLTKKQFNAAEKATETYLRNFVLGSDYSGASFDVTAKALSSSPVYRQLVDKQRGSVTKALTDTQYLNLAKSLLISTGAKQDTSAFSSRPFLYSPTLRDVSQTIPKQFREAYSSIVPGQRPSSDVAQVVKKYNEAVSEGTVSKDVINKLVNAATLSKANGGANDVLERLLYESGIIQHSTKEHGRVRAMDNVPISLGRHLAALAIERQKIYKSSDQPYYIDINSSTQQDKLLGRNGQRVTKADEILSILSEDPNLNGAAFMTPQELKEYGQSAAYRTLGKDNKLRTVGYAPTFYAPQITYGKDGFTTSDPNWKKQGVIAKGTDQTAIVSYSPIMSLLRYKPEDSMTYGNGRNTETGRPIYSGKENVLKINGSSLVHTDKDGYVVMGDTHGANTSGAAYQEFRNILDPEKGFRYVPQMEDGTKGEAQDYVYGWQNGVDYYMVRKDKAQDINRRFAGAGIASPLRGSTFSGFYHPENYENTIKGINYNKLMSTPSVPLSYLDSGYDTTNLRSFIAPVDSEVLYDAFGIDNKQKIDAASFIMPEFAPFDFQGRIGNAAKFMAQRLDFKDMFKQAYLIKDATTGEYTGLNEATTHGNKLISFKDGRLSVLMPSIGASKEVVQRGAAGTLTDEERAKYFTDVMGDDIQQILFDSSVKPSEFFRNIPLSAYARQHGRSGETRSPLDIALENYGESEISLVKNGENIDYDKSVISVLNAQDQREYLKKYLDLTGGLWAVESDEQFDISKSRMVNQMVRAFQLPAKMQAANEAKYGQQIKNLLTFEGRKKFLDSNAEYAATSESKTPNGYVSAAANRIINKEIATLNQRKLNGEYDIGFGNVVSGLAKVNPATMLRMFGTQLGDLKGTDLDVFNTNKVFSNLMRGLSNTVAIARFPNSTGENDITDRASNAEIDAYLDKIAELSGMSKEDVEGVFLNPENLYRYNTGDYDGDTVWMYGIMDQYSEEAKRRHQFVEKQLQIQEDRKAEIAKNNPKQKVASQKALSPSEMFIAAGTQKEAAQMAMGRADSVLRKADTLPDNNPLKWVLYSDAKEYYDAATSNIAKKGENIVAPDSFRSSNGIFRTYDKFSQYVAKVAADKEDTIKPSKDNLFSTDLYNLNDIAAMSSAMRSAADFKGFDPKALDEFYTYYNKAGFDPNTAEGRAAEAYMRLYQEVVGSGRFVTAEDVEKLRGYSKNWGFSINERGVANNSEEAQRYLDFNKLISRYESDDDSTYTLRNAQTRVKQAQTTLSSLAKRRKSEGKKTVQELIAERNQKAREEGRNVSGSVITTELLEELDDLRKNGTDEEQAASQQDYDDILRHLNAVNEKDVFQRLINNNKKITGLYEATNPYSQDYQTARANEINRSAQLQNKELSQLEQGILYGIDPLSKLKESVTYVEPWMTPKSHLHVSKTDLATGETVDIPAMITEMGDEKSQLDKINQMLFGSTSTLPMVLGSAIHKVFEDNAYGGNAKGSLDNLYNQLSDANAFGKQLASISVRYDKDAGKFISISDRGSASELDIQNANNVLAQISGSKTGKSTFDLFNSYLKSNKEKVVYSEDRFLDDRTGTFVPANNNYDIYVGPQDKQQKKRVTVKPDTITQAEDGSYNIYDYKASENEAAKSFAQTMFYAKAIEHNLVDAPFFRDLVDDSGHVKIGKLRSYDYNNGNMYELDYNDEHAEEIFNEVKGIQQQLGLDAASALDQYLKGDTQSLWARAIKDRVSNQRFGLSNGAQQAAQTWDNAKQTTQNVPQISDAQFQLFAAQYSADKENLSDLQSKVFKERFKKGIPNEGGYSVLSRFAKQAEDLFGNTNDLRELENKLRSTGQTQSADEITQKINEKINLINEIDKLIISSAKSDIDDIKQVLDTQANGTQKNELINQFSFANSKYNAARARIEVIRDRNILKDKNGNPILDAEGNVTWTNEDAKALYRELSNESVDENGKALPGTLGEIRESAMESMQRSVDNYEKKLSKQERSIGLRSLTKKQTNGTYETSNFINDRLTGLEQLENYSKLVDLEKQTQADIDDYADKLAHGSSQLEQPYLKQAQTTALFALSDIKSNKEKYSQSLLQALPQDIQNIVNQGVQRNHVPTEDEYIKRGVSAATLNALGSIESLNALRETLEKTGFNEKDNRELFNQINEAKAELSQYIENPDKLQEKYQQEYEYNKEKSDIANRRQLEYIQKQGELIDRNNPISSQFRGLLSRGVGGVGGRTAYVQQGIIQGLENQKLSYDRQIEDVDLALKNPSLVFGSDEYNKLIDKKNLLKENSSKIESQLKTASGAGATLSIGAAQMGEAVSALITRAMRRLLKSAYNEAKKFILSFDESMTQIQTITMKSDSEMEAIKKRTISTAIGMKASVADVSTVQASLYRQGLSDSEVQNRTKTILQFSKVTGINADTATKAVTVAIQNGLVASAQEAADALTALGDAAATTAAEIEKGIEKSAATAAATGVSYAELVAMMTIGTEKTQLSGTQVGTALNTIFSRIQKVTNENAVTDAAGVTTSLNDVDTSLRSAGVSIFEDNGKFKSSSKILYELSKVWEDLSDVQRSNITYTMAGTRQTNIFSSIMEGMAENGGAAYEDYLDKATNSAGITADKYEIAIQSINSSITELKSNFDGLIESLTNNGALTGFIDFGNNFVNALKSASDSVGGFIPVLEVLGIALTAIAAKFALAALSAGALKGGVAGAALTMATIAAGAVAIPLLIGSKSSNATNAQTSIDYANAEYDRFNNENTKVNQALSVIKNSNSNIDEDSIKSSLETLSPVSNTAKAALQDLSSAISNLGEVSGKVQEDVDNWSQTQKDRMLYEALNDYMAKPENERKTINDAIEFVPQDYSFFKSAHFKTPDTAPAKLQFGKYADDDGYVMFAYPNGDQSQYNGAINRWNNYISNQVKDFDLPTEREYKNYTDADKLVSLRGYDIDSSSYKQYISLRSLDYIDSMIIPELKNQKLAKLNNDSSFNQEYYDLLTYINQSINDYINTGVKGEETYEDQIMKMFTDTSYLPAILFSSIGVTNEDQLKTYASDFITQYPESKGVDVNEVIYSFINSIRDTSGYKITSPNYDFGAYRQELTNPGIRNKKYKFTSDNTTSKEYNTEDEAYLDQFGITKEQASQQQWLHIANNIKRYSSGFSTVDSGSETTRIFSNPEDAIANIGRDVFGTNTEYSSEFENYIKEYLSQMFEYVLETEYGGEKTSTTYHGFDVDQILKNAHPNYADLSVEQYNGLRQKILSNMKPLDYWVYKNNENIIPSYKYKYTTSDVFGNSPEEIAKQIYGDKYTKEQLQEIKNQMVNSSSGKAYLRSLSDIAKDTYTSQKLDNKKYTDEYRKLLNYANTSEDYSEFEELVGKQFENIEALLGSNEELSKLINDVSSGLTDPSDGWNRIKEVIEKQVNGITDVNSMIESVSSTLSISKTIGTRDRINNGTATVEDINTVMNALGITDVSEYYNNQLYYNMLYGRQTDSSLLNERASISDWINPLYESWFNDLSDTEKHNLVKNNSYLGDFEQYLSGTKYGDLYKYYKDKGYGFGISGASANSQGLISVDSSNVIGYKPIENKVYTPYQVASTAQDILTKIINAADNERVKTYDNELAQIYQDQFLYNQVQDKYGNGLQQLASLDMSSPDYEANRQSLIKQLQDQINTDIILGQMINNPYYNDIISAYSVFSGNNDYSKLAQVQAWTSEREKYNNAQWYINNGNWYDSTAVSTIASATGYSEDKVAKMMKYGNTSELDKALDLAYERIQTVTSSMVEAVVPEDILSKSAGKGTKSLLDNLPSTIDSFVRQMIEGLGISVNENGEVITTGIISNKSNVQTLDSLVAQYNSEQTQDRNITDRYYEWLKNSSESSFTFKADENESNFFNNHKRLAVLGSMRDQSWVTQDVIDSAIYSDMFGKHNNYVDAEIAKAALGPEMFGFREGTATQEDVSSAVSAFEELYNARPELFDYLMNDTDLGLNDAFAGLTQGGESAIDTLEALNEQFQGYKLAEKYGKEANNVAKGMDIFSKDARKSSAAMKDFNAKLADVKEHQWLKTQFAKGVNTGEVAKGIASITGLDEKDVAKEEYKDYIKNILDGITEADISDTQFNIADVINEQLALSGPLSVDGQNIIINPGTLSYNDQELLSQLGVSIGSTVDNLIQLMANAGISAHWEQEVNGEVAYAKLVVDSIGGSGAHATGGGGGGKSKSDKLIEKLKRQLSVYEHQIKMVQYQESKYEGRGEIGNQNRMIELENMKQSEYAEQIRNAIDQLTAQMSTVKKDSDDWYNLRDAILSYEESLEDVNNTIEENTRKIKENEQAIRKTIISVEDEANEEIKQRIEEERDMLDGAVSAQETILEAIRNRYQTEWDLIKDDIEEKKKALEEEKDLIQQRLDARKNAEDEAEKYRQLDEYKAQLSYIETDYTRTKDAAELREKIAQLEKEIGWDIAEEENKYIIESIDDEIKAYDEQIQIGDERLEAMLEDANNFTDEITKILEGSMEEIIDWLKGNVDEYNNGLNKMKEQTVWEWKDMIKQMRGETDVYWDDIKDIMESEDSFIEYMKESSSYLNASDTDREYMIEEWRKLYQDMVAAQKIDADYDHSDTDFQTSSSVSSGTGSGGGGGGSYNDEDYQNIKRKISYTYGGKPIEHTVVGTLADAKRMVGIFAAQDAASLTDHITDEDRLRTIANQMMAKAVISKYANGGLIDFTGPAWVDGSPSRPEAILDAEDTSILRQILDACGKIKIPSFMSSISDALFGHNNSIGDVSITINEATINNDDDIETLAEKVGDAFVKQLSKQGFNTADYAI